MSLDYLANGNCIACCLQQINAMFLSRDTSHYLFTPWSSPTWEANRFSASQEIPRILWTTKVQYRIHTCPSPVLLLSQLCPVYVSTSQFLTVQLNIILPSTPGFPKWFLWFRFPQQNPVYASPLHHIRYMHAHLVDFNLNTPTIFGKQ